MRPPGWLRLAACGLWLVVPRASRAAPDWPNIVPSELAATHASIDPDADAEAMLWTVRITDAIRDNEPSSVREYYFRIKVFTAEGARHWAKQTIDRSSTDVSIRDLAARTIAPDGSVRVMDRKAISEEILVKSAKRGMRRTSFVLPGVQPGCILEYRYTEYWTGYDITASFLPLQLDIPVRRVEYRVRPLVAEGVNLQQLTFHTHVRPSDREQDGYFATVADNQPAFVEEPDMPPPLQQQGFILLFYTNDASRDARTFWKRVGQDKAEWFDAATRPDKGLREDASRFVAGAGDDRDKVRRIAEHVQNEFQIVRSGGKDSLAAHHLHEIKDARAAWRQHGGSIEDAELAFAALVRASGLDARWVMAPTRSELFFDPNMISENFLDSYQVAVRLGGRWTTFDPVTEFLPWDMLLWREEATTALLCDKDSTGFIETSWSQPEQSVLGRRASLELQPDGTLEGTLRVTCGGHYNAETREALRGLNGAEADSLLAGSESSAGVLDTKDVSIANLDRPREPLQWNAHITLPGFATVTGKRILLEPSVFRAREKPRFTASRRTHPVYFAHPWTELDTVVIRIPDGWRLEPSAAPQPVIAEGAGDYVSSLTTSDDSRSLTFVRRQRIGFDGAVLFPLDSYPGVKQLFEKFQERDGFTVAFSRASTSP